MAECQEGSVRVRRALSGICCGIGRQTNGRVNELPQPCGYLHIASSHLPHAITTTPHWPATIKDPILETNSLK